jgi:hypothetical protein
VQGDFSRKGSRWNASRRRKGECLPRELISRYWSIAERERACCRFAGIVARRFRLGPPLQTRSLLQIGQFAEAGGIVLASTRRDAIGRHHQGLLAHGKDEGDDEQNRKNCSRYGSGKSS